MLEMATLCLDGGAHFLKQSVYYGGCVCIIEYQFFRVNQAVFSVFADFVTPSPSAESHSSAKTTASSYSRVGLPTAVYWLDRLHADGLRSDEAGGIHVNDMAVATVNVVDKLP